MALLSTLSIGTRGLFAAQMGMDVAGQNISNVDVAGYSRKRLNMSTDYRRDGEFGQVGMGVDVVNITRMRDAMIDTQIRNQSQQVGYFKSIDSAMQSIESVFADSGENSLNSQINNFFDSWQNVVNNPSDISARTMVKSSADILTGVFHNASNEMRSLRISMNEQIAAKGARINEIVKEVYNLNNQIGAVEAGDQNANDSRDARDLLLKELSGLIDIDTHENDQGQVTVTSAGSILVSPADYRQLETTTASFQLADGTTANNVGLRFADTKRVYYPQSGEIKGLMESRDVVIPEFENKLDTLARSMVQEVNRVHSAGYSLHGYTGINFFDIGVTGASDIELSAEIQADVQNIAAASGGAPAAAVTTAVAGGQLNFGVAPQQLAKNLGVVWTAADPLTERARNIVHGSVRVVANGATLLENRDFSVDYVNGTIQMLHPGYDGTNLTVNFFYDSGQFNGPGDNTNALAVAQLREQLTMVPDPLGNNTNTFTQYYSSFIGELGLMRNEATSNLETRTFLVSQYEAHQDSVAGVSLDEEMADIIKYQHSYTAAARLISTVDEMLNVLMNM